MISQPWWMTPEDPIGWWSKYLRKYLGGVSGGWILRKCLDPLGQLRRVCSSSKSGGKRCQLDWWRMTINSKRHINTSQVKPQESPPPENQKVWYQSETVTSNPDLYDEEWATQVISPSLRSMAFLPTRSCRPLLHGSQTPNMYHTMLYNSMSVYIYIYMYRYIYIYACKYISWYNIACIYIYIPRFIQWIGQFISLLLSLLS